MLLIVFLSQQFSSYAVAQGGETGHCRFSERPSSQFEIRYAHCDPEKDIYPNSSDYSQVFVKDKINYLLLPTEDKSICFCVGVFGLPNEIYELAISYYREFFDLDPKLKGKVKLYRGKGYFDFDGDVQKPTVFEDIISTDKYDDYHFNPKLNEDDALEEFHSCLNNRSISCVLMDNDYLDYVQGYRIPGALVDKYEFIARNAIKVRFVPNDAGSWVPFYVGTGQEDRDVKDLAATNTLLKNFRIRISQIGFNSRARSVFREVDYTFLQATVFQER